MSFGQSEPEAQATGSERAVPDRGAARRDELTASIGHQAESVDSDRKIKEKPSGSDVGGQPLTAERDQSSDDAADQAQQSSWWLRRADQVVLAVLVAICTVLIAVHQFRLSGGGRRPIEVHRLPQRELDYRVDINRAQWFEWVQLPGIGRTLAERIVEDRQARGPFESIEDLDRVRGIGPKTVERLRPYVMVGESDSDKVRGPNDSSLNNTGLNR